MLFLLVFKIKLICHFLADVRSSLLVYDAQLEKQNTMDQLNLMQTNLSNSSFAQNNG